MIIDSLLGLERYFSINPGVEKAFKFLRQQPLESLAEGRHDIDGDNVYAMVSENPGKKQEEAKLEVHDAYIDIQLVVKGQESFGYLDRRFCKEVLTPYDSARDVAFYDDVPEVFFSLEPGNIAIFFPYDGHAPMIGAGLIRKIIVKVKV